MGLGDLWKRLMGGDEAERVEEQLRDEGREQPEPLQDYEAGKDDTQLDERFRGAGTIGENSDL
jgi:hypothetical protein